MGSSVRHGNVFFSIVGSHSRGGEAVKAPDNVHTEKGKLRGNRTNPVRLVIRVLTTRPNRLTKAKDQTPDGMFCIKKIKDKKRRWIQNFVNNSSSESKFSNQRRPNRLPDIVPLVCMSGYSCRWCLMTANGICDPVSEWNWNEKRQDRHSVAAFYFYL